mgnify:CR=1 FL=1
MQRNHHISLNFDAVMSMYGQYMFGLPLEGPARYPLLMASGQIVNFSWRVGLTADEAEPFHSEALGIATSLGGIVGTRAPLLFELQATRLDVFALEQRRQEEREAMLAERARESGCAIAYVNLVGGQDDLVFDGDSFVCNRAGKVIARAPQFVEHLTVVDLALPAARPELRGRVNELSLIGSQWVRSGKGCSRSVPG